MDIGLIWKDVWLLERFDVLKRGRVQGTANQLIKHGENMEFSSFVSVSEREELTINTRSTEFIQGAPIVRSDIELTNGK